MAASSNRHKNMGRLVEDAMTDLYDEPYYEEEVDEWAAWEGMDEALIGRRFGDKMSYSAKSMR